MKQAYDHMNPALPQAPEAILDRRNYLISFFAKLLDTLWIWQQRASERYRLQQISDHMLKDMGLNRADVEAEANKPFWRA